MSDVISVTGLEVRFPGCDALRGVDLHVPQGTVVALLGENGAGKTTLIRALTGFLRPNAGSCRVLGMDPTHDAVEIRRRVGYVSDSPAMYDWMRVSEIGWFAASFYPEGYLEKYRDTIERYEVPSNRKLRNLSKGQRAKVALALALAHDPELLILDEPTSGVDPLVRREFLESMLDRVATGRTVLLSSHQISDVERVADRVAILHEGKFRIADSLTDLRGSICEVIISLDDPLVALPAIELPAEVLSEQMKGRQRRMIIRDFDETVRDQLATRPNVTNVHVRTATLDDLFVACIRGKASTASNDRSDLHGSPVLDTDPDSSTDVAEVT